MRKWLLFLIVGGSLSGCASAPVDPWQGLTVDTKAAVRHIDCGSFPLPSEVIGESIVYDQAAVNDLEAYRACTEDNAALVDLHADQIGQLKIARAALVDAGKAQRNIAVMRLEMLEDERRHNAWKSLGYWIAIIGMASAL